MRKMSHIMQDEHISFQAIIGRMLIMYAESGVKFHYLH